MFFDLNSLVMRSLRRVWKQTPTSATRGCELEAKRQLTAGRIHVLQLAQTSLATPLSPPSPLAPTNSLAHLVSAVSTTTTPSTERSTAEAMRDSDSSSIVASCATTPTTPASPEESTMEIAFVIEAPTGPYRAARTLSTEGGQRGEERERREVKKREQSMLLHHATLALVERATGGSETARRRAKVSQMW